MHKTCFNIFENDLELYSSKWSHYFDIYERYFSKFIGHTINVLEIGVDNGGSLEMWHKYFGDDAMIFGVDINPKIQTGDIKNTFISRGDQGNSDFWDHYISEHNRLNMGKFDIIIDDGSHQFDHQRLTFFKLYPYLINGGIYMIEDTHTSYLPEYQGKPFTETCKEVVDVLHAECAQHYSFFNQDQNVAQYINSVHFYDSVIVFEKFPRNRNEVLYANREKYRR
jgi:hypothetical protein